MPQILYKPLLLNRKYGQKCEDLEFIVNAHSLIERADVPLAGHWRRIEEAETA